MAPLHGDLFHRWEKEVRESSCRGLAGLLPPAEEWGSFLDAPADPVSDGEFYSQDLASALGGNAELREGAGAPTAPEEAPAAPQEVSQTGSPLHELPESQLPEKLRAEIEEFLNKDRPTRTSEDDLKTYLKGGFDPNVEPDEK